MEYSKETGGLLPTTTTTRETVGSLPTTTGPIKEPLPFPNPVHGMQPLLGGGTAVTNYLLSGQQPLTIPVSGSFHKVFVKPIAPKQTVGPTLGLVSPGLVVATNGTGYGPMMGMSQKVTSTSTPPLPPSLPTNNVQPSSGTSSPPPHSVHNTTSSADQTLPSTKPIKRRTSSQSSSVSNVSVSANKPRKPCNCKNSQCLKLYCDCFANGEFCRDSCNCQNCKNSFQHEEDRSRAVKACLERNPNAFKPKVGHGRVGDERRHIKGCNCKKSSCLKNYCECYEAKIPCSHLCRCVGCQNLADRPEGKGLMQLANAADLRTQQQKAASSHFLEDMFTPQFVQSSHTEEGQRLPYSFVNKDVTKATTLCLLEEASHSASSGKSPVDVERAVLIEFGRCLEQIINSSESANQSATHREQVSGRC